MGHRAPSADADRGPTRTCGSSSGSANDRKGAQSRLKNEKMLAAWSGASGTGRLTYRWGTVKVIVNDIMRGLDDAGA